MPGNAIYGASQSILPVLLWSILVCNIKIGDHDVFLGKGRHIRPYSSDRSCAVGERDEVVLDFERVGAICNCQVAVIQCLWEA